MLRLGSTIFLSAFLLFQVQPLLGKYILPWFGGGATVWITCLLFFQLMLFLGYAYAYFSSSYLPARIGSGIHLVLLAFSLFFLPIDPSPIWKNPAGVPPVSKILLLLVATVGLPYLLLSATAPLVQRWHAERYLGGAPYRLYGLSNTGSLVALISYPFAIEPWVSLQSQSAGWSVTYGVFVLMVGWSVYCSGFRDHTSHRFDISNQDPNQVRTGQSPDLMIALLWIAFSAVGAALLLATTNQMCQEIAVVPFLWITPLSIYLITFVVCFGYERFYDRRIIGFLIGASAPIAMVVFAAGLRVAIVYHIVAYAVALFACCMCCNGELVKIKPPPQYLTLFYLAISFGGVLGGIFVTFIAPYVFSDFSEYPLLLASCGILALVQWCRSRAWLLYIGKQYWIIGPVAGMVLTIVTAVVLIDSRASVNKILTSRNFYGVLHLTQERTGRDEILQLTHGRVIHGSQFVADERRAWPTTYYGPKSGLSLAMSRHPRRIDPFDTSIRVGVVGLGAGTAAIHASEGDYIRFYEINSAVINIANNYFSYLKHSSAKIDIIHGDARIQMEYELARNDFQRFDILVVDAFSSDAIPIHLLTAECSNIYWRHLESDGLLLFHISNETLNLAPVIHGLANLNGATAAAIISDGDRERGTSSATWIVVTKNQEFLADEFVRAELAKNVTPQLTPIAWTDDFASIWSVLK